LDLSIYDSFAIKYVIIIEFFINILIYNNIYIIHKLFPIIIFIGA